MGQVARFTISIEPSLLDEFDAYCKDRRFASRSDGMRQILRETFTRRRVENPGDGEAVGTLTLVYDHHHGHLTDRLVKLQHDHSEQVISTLHVHLDHDQCLEVVVLRGTVGNLAELADQLRGLKGIHQGELVIARVRESKPHAVHPHSHAGRRH